MQGIPAHLTNFQNCQVILPPVSGELNYSVAVCAKPEAKIARMQTAIGHNLTRRVKFWTPLPWEPIDKLHNMQNHTDNHNARHLFKWYTVMERSNLLLEEPDVPLNQATVL